MRSPERQFAIFGRFPALSAAELFAVSGNEQKTVLAVTPHGAVVAASHTLPLGRLGGTIKVGTMLERYPSWDATVAAIGAPPFLSALAAKGSGKFFVGVSIYARHWNARKIAAESRRLGWLLKQAATASGRSARWVTSREPTLSSVVVAKNHLLDRGAEIVFLEDEGQWWVGTTTAVQDFARYSGRDYGRPHRDDASGMLPPKLAQILVNLSGAPMKGTAPLVDPFCGSGTVLMEALLLGQHIVYGSDSSAKAVQDTQENLAWLSQNERLPSGASWQVVHSDVRKIDRAFPALRFGVVVTEPYLGPQRGLSVRHLPKVSEALTTLYRDAFRAFARVLTPEGTVAIVFPAFFFNREPQYLPLDAVVGEGFTPALPTIERLLDLFPSDVTPRQSLLYHRPGQKVGREIFVFRRT